MPYRPGSTHCKRCDITLRPRESTNWYAVSDRELTPVRQAPEGGLVDNISTATADELQVVLKTSAVSWQCDFLEAASQIDQALRAFLDAHY